MPETSLHLDMSAEHAAMSVHLAVADFVLAIHEAQTSDEALRIHQLIAETLRALEAAESAALDRADTLNGRI